MSVKVAIVDASAGRKGHGVRWVAGKLREVLVMLGVLSCEWTITIVGDEEMADLHQRTLGQASTTDVLTFDMRDEQGAAREGAAVERDTVLCAAEAGRRAGELGHGVREELLLYAVHSLLHVQGYDDVTPSKARRMHRREDELLGALGVGAVYGRKRGQP